MLCVRQREKHVPLRHAYCAFLSDFTFRPCLPQLHIIRGISAKHWPTCLLKSAKSSTNVSRSCTHTYIHAHILTHSQQTCYTLIICNRAPSTTAIYASSICVSLTRFHILLHPYFVVEFIWRQLTHLHFPRVAAFFSLILSHLQTWYTCRLGPSITSATP